MSLNHGYKNIKLISDRMLKIKFAAMLESELCAFHEKLQSQVLSVLK